MRTFIALASCLLIAGCSSGDALTTPVSSLSRYGDAFEACDLLSHDEVVKLADEAVSAAKPGSISGVPNCQWETADGRYVQTIGSSASDWAKSLPEVLQTFEESGQYANTDDLEKLRDAVAPVEAGQDIEPAEACSLFSEVLELQGQPAGTTRSLAVYPTQENPQAVIGQICTDGRFTSVMVAAEAGLEEPLPVERVAQAAKAAHNRNIG